MVLYHKSTFFLIREKWLTRKKDLSLPNHFSRITSGCRINGPSGIVLKKKQGCFINNHESRVETSRISLIGLTHQDVCARLTLSQLPSMVSLNCNLLNLATKSVLKSLVPPLAATVFRVGNLETLPMSFYNLP